MAKFRKKPVVIEAMRFLAYTEALAPDVGNGYVPGKLYQWMTDRGAKYRKDFYVDQDDGPVFLIIKTLEGDHRADIGDWIIQGVKGEFYPCKPDIFKMTYEPVD